MSSNKYPAGGEAEVTVPAPSLFEQQLTYISRVLQAHEKTDCHGARDVHVLFPAPLSTQLFHRWRLVEFHDPEYSRLNPGLPQNSDKLINGEQLPGWIIPEAVRDKKPLVPVPHRPSILLLSDMNCAIAENGTPVWESKEDRTLIPNDVLQPLAEVPNIDLLTVARSLWMLLPYAYRADPREFS